MENLETFKGFTPKTKEEVGQMSEEQAKDRLRILDAEFQRISEDPEHDESFDQDRAPIDAELSRIFDQFPELQAWYDNEL